MESDTIATKTYGQTGQKVTVGCYDMNILSREGGSKVANKRYI